MNRKIEKLTCLTLTLMIVLSSVMVLSNVAAQARPSVIVTPTNNTFFTNVTHVGDTFMVTIAAADWVDPGLYSFEFKLGFDPTLLQPVTGKTGVPSDGLITTFVAANATLDTNTLTYGATLLGDDKRVGGGILGVATFKILAEPPVAGSVGCNLSLIGVIMVNPTTTRPYDAGTYDIVSGTYQLVSPPPPSPTLVVSSKAWDNSAADAAGRLFSITISIQGLDASWHAVGFQFRLNYNATLITTDANSVFEGDFLTPFGLNAGGTFNMTSVDTGVLFGDIVLPPWPDPADLDKWAHGSGVLATVQFNAVYRPPPAVIGSPLTLSDVLIVDYQSKPLPTVNTVAGTYTISVAAPPWLSVDPQAFTFEQKGSQLGLKANLNQIDKGFRLVGTEFKVQYDTTLLQISSITEGDFLKGFATSGGTDTFFQSYIEEDFGLVGIIILPLPNGTWPDSVFPVGTGTLATLTFQSIVDVQGSEPILTNVTLFDPLLVDADAKVIPINEQLTQQQGTCVCTLVTAIPPPPPPPPPPGQTGPDRVLDLFTQYDAPYGG